MITMKFHLFVCKLSVGGGAFPGVIPLSPGQAGKLFKPVNSRWLMPYEKRWHCVKERHVVIKTKLQHEDGQIEQQLNVTICEPEQPIAIEDTIIQIQIPTALAALDISSDAYLRPIQFYARRVTHGIEVINVQPMVNVTLKKQDTDENE
jgi:hypothetical protein